MSAIPINPSIIANAGVYTASSSAISQNLCTPPKEGLKSISMQFAFAQKAGWQVSFSNSPNVLMTQLAALFVDTSQCNFDINIYFPDTGYTVRIEQGGGRLIPVFTGATSGSLPNFYVLLDSSGVLDNSLCNILAFNQYIPSFESGLIERVASYGYGANGKLVPSLAQSTTFSAGLTGIDLTTPQVIINAKQWYITGIQVNGFIQNPSMTQFGEGLFFNDVAIGLAFAWVSGTDQAIAQVFLDLPAFSYISQGSGPLYFLVPGLTNLINYVIYCNVFGGILIP